jgi:hypothetical protein
MILFSHRWREDFLGRLGRYGPEAKLFAGLLSRMGIEPNLSRGFGVLVMRIIVSSDWRVSGVGGQCLAGAPRNAKMPPSLN